MKILAICSLFVLHGLAVYGKISKIKWLEEILKYLWNTLQRILVSSSKAILVQIFPVIQNE